MLFAYVVPSDTPVRKVRAGTLPPGTGPYRVERWDPDRGGVLVRNPYFRSWSPEARPAGFVDRIEVRVRPFKRIETQIGDVLAGRSDVVMVANAFTSHVSPARLQALYTRAPGQLRSFPGGSDNWMFLNVREPPFDDLEVRRALNLATDRARLVEIGGGPVLATPTCQFVPAGFPGYEPYCPYTASPAPGRGWSAPDVERARALIARSGRAGERVVVWVSDYQRAIGRYFTTLLGQLGFRASLKVLGDEYFPTIFSPRESPQMGYLGWALDYLSAASFVQQTFACESVGGDPNASRFCDPEVDRLVAAALDADRGEEAHAWAVADHGVVDRAPAVPMTNRRAVILTSRRVGNLQFHMVWSTLLDQLWVR